MSRSIYPMTEGQKVQQFCNELDNLIDRYSIESDLCYASIIGALNLKSHQMCVEAYQEDSADAAD